MTGSRASFHRTLQTEIKGRFRDIALRAHLSLTIHGAGTIGDDMESDLFVDVLREAIRDLIDNPRKEDP